MPGFPRDPKKWTRRHARAADALARKRYKRFEEAENRFTDLEETGADEEEVVFANARMERLEALHAQAEARVTTIDNFADYK